MEDDAFPVETVPFFKKGGDYIIVQTGPAFK